MDELIVSWLLPERGPSILEAWRAIGRINRAPLHGQPRWTLILSNARCENGRMTLHFVRFNPAHRVAYFQGQDKGGKPTLSNPVPVYDDFDFDALIPADATWTTEE